MQKTLKGKIISLKMADTAVVIVERRVAHPLYKKLLKKTKKYLVDMGGLELNLGDNVRIGEVKRISKNKYFKVLEVIAK